jgi:hypothetical protein
VAAPFRQTDVTRAVRGVVAGGVSVSHVEVTRDTIRVFAADGPDRPEAADSEDIEAALRKLENGPRENRLLRRP